MRAKAYEALMAAARGPDFEEARELTYLTEIRYQSFESFRDHRLAVAESRRPAVEAREEELRAAFEANAERCDGAFVFAQPARLNLLLRR